MSAAKKKAPAAKKKKSVAAAPVVFLQQAPQRALENAAGVVRLPGQLYLNEKAGFGEDGETEFKLAFHGHYGDQYRRTMNAFLNTGGGVIYFGVADDGTVKGITPKGGSDLVKEADQMRLWVDSTQSTLFLPAVHSIKVHMYKLTRDLAVWAIVVPKSDVPVYFQHTVYKRLNASTVAHRKQTILTPDDALAVEAKQSHVATENQTLKQKLELAAAELREKERQALDSAAQLDEKTRLTTAATARLQDITHHAQQLRQDHMPQNHKSLDEKEEIPADPLDALGVILRDKACEISALSDAVSKEKTTASQLAMQNKLLAEQIKQKAELYENLAQVTRQLINTHHRDDRFPLPAKRVTDPPIPTTWLSTLANALCSFFQSE